MRPPSSPAGRSWLARVATLLVTIGLLGGQLGKVAHLLLVEHARCAHGELVHGHEGAAPDAAAGAGHAANHESDHAARGDDDGRALASPSLASADGDHEEDHCDALTVLHRLSGPVGHVASASVLCLLPAPSLQGSGASPALTQLTLAPKASPPDVARAPHSQA